MEKETPPQRPNEAQETPQARRRRLVGGVAAAVVLLALLVWAVQLVVEQQKLERCLASKRPDCFHIDAPPRDGPADLRR